MSFYQLNFIISYLFTGIILGFLAFFVFLKNSKNKLNLSFSAYSISIAWWSIFSVFMLTAGDEATATHWDRICLLGVVFIPTTFLHFTWYFLQKKVLIEKYIKYYYCLSFLFAFLIWTPFFIKGTGPVHKLPYFTVPEVGYLVFLFYYTATVIFCIYQLLISYINEHEPTNKQQKLYLVISTIFGYIGGSFNYNLVLQYPPYEFAPFGNYFIGIYGLVVAYAIVKYKLLDIKVAITRAGVFLVVYVFVLGVPFYVGLKYELWKHATWLMLVFATSGPYIYMFLQKKAESKLLQEQRSYQGTLRKASLGMGRVKDLKRLLGLIVHVVTRTVKIEHCAIYLYHQESNQYILKASKGLTDQEDVQSILASNSPLIDFLKNNNEVLDYEIVKQKSKDYDDIKLNSIQSIIKRLNGALIIPSFIEDRLLAVIVLGKKKSGKPYSHDDMVVFSILANQSALAIENAQFYEDMKKTHKQLFEAEKMATIGTMADGLSHQINNRLHAMGFIAGDAIDTLNLKEGKFKSKEAKELSAEMKNALLKIEDNVKRGGEIVGGLLKYTRKGKEGYESIKFDELLSASVEMVGLKVKLNEFDIIRNYNGNLPKINGNFTQLQEVLFNIIDNAYDAMRQRKLELKEEGYRGQLIFTAQRLGRNLEIVIQDNGIGIKERDKAKLFTPFFTTKHSKVKKGTGLGLYVIRQLIERNHNGKVEFSGEYKKGATTRIVLPLS